MTLNRRQIFTSAAQLAALAVLFRQGAVPALADAAPLLTDKAEEFPDDYVRTLAKELSTKPFKDEQLKLPAELDKLTYDQYRNIRFNPDRSIWKGEPHNFSFDVFHPGFLFTRPVDIYVVENNRQARLKYDPSLFVFGGDVKPPDGKNDLHFAGLRLRFPINTPGIFDEVAVFQGASYFRAVGKGLLYGLSARGLAIDVGQPTGEEFPFFRAFWVRKPEAPAGVIVVEALLDSPSITGAYRFSIKPGEDTQMDVEMTLYPRRDLEHVGIAPVTSMFLFDSLARPVADYRNAVHDSDGLMMLTGTGEWLWRPLANPKALQVSAFQDLSPRGFGLMQRARRYEDYLDLEAKYEKRPSLWIEPIGDWSAGAVELYEIPTLFETNDNIVAMWHPKDPLKKGESRAYVYRLHWCPEWPLVAPPQPATVVFSGSGVDIDYAKNPPEINPDLRLYVVEFSGGENAVTATPDVTVSTGTISNVVLYTNDQTHTTRLSFRHDTQGADLAELRAVLKRGETNASETWLYRWTRG